MGVDTTDFSGVKIRFASWLDKRIIGSGRGSRICNYLWKISIAVGILAEDPIVVRQIGENRLLMNASHKLWQRQQRLPYYETALPRLAKFLRDEIGPLVVIDIGANIG